jgi:hypothetical protein
MANRTLTAAKAVRCKTVEGAQQCIKEQHPKIKGHTWGPLGETAQWNADGTPKVTPDAPTDEFGSVPGKGYVPVPNEVALSQAAAMVRHTNGNGRSSDDEAFAESIRLATHVEDLRVDVHTGTDCLSAVVEARRQVDAARAASGHHQAVDADTIKAIVDAARHLERFGESWLAQRGLIKSEGAGS